MVRNKMAFLLKTILLLVFLLYISNVIFVKAEDSSADGSAPCLNCPDCTQPCQPFPPPQPYPVYGAPPPPSPPCQDHGAPPSPLCEGYGAPPPPSPVQCPPTPVQSGQNFPPRGPGSSNLPYYNYSVSPPLPTSHRICSALFSILLFFYLVL